VPPFEAGGDADVNSRKAFPPLDDGYLQ